MKMGRCLQDHDSLLNALGNDPMFIGCSVDVLSMMGMKCSGLNHCEVHGTDIGFRQANPCYASLMKYMEASYECMTGKMFESLQYYGADYFSIHKNAPLDSYLKV